MIKITPKPILENLSIVKQWGQYPNGLYYVELIKGLYFKEYKGGLVNSLDSLTEYSLSKEFRNVFKKLDL